MAGYNRIIIVGNLTRDPDYKQLSSGQAVCQLGLASNRQYRNKQTGSMVQEVCFVDVDVFGPQAESCKQYLQKGRSVLVEGRLKFDSWESMEGQKRTKHSIVADRVVFLTPAGGVDIESGARQEDTFQEAAPQEFSAARQPKKSMKKQEANAAHAMMAQRETSGDEISSSTGELAFNDEPPFQDDLPF